MIYKFKEKIYTAPDYLIISFFTDLYILVFTSLFYKQKNYIYFFKNTVFSNIGQARKWIKTLFIFL